MCKVDFELYVDVMNIIFIGELEKVCLVYDVVYKKI